MDISIDTAEKIKETMPSLLQTIAERLQSAGIQGIQQIKANVEGQKDGGITLAISIAGLVVSSLGTFFSIIAFLKKQHPSLVVKATYGNASLEVQDYTPQQLKEVVSRLEGQQGDKLEIKIS